MKKVAFYTLGCKVNQYETEAMLEMFEKNGYEKSGIRKGFYSKPKEDALIMWKYFQ